MDEFGSPIAGGIRAVRNTVSSSVFTGRAVPPPVQPDPITTNLISQNSLSLTRVSSQLETISGQVAGLNGSLASIKENLALSDQLERQREIAKQNRERILAEQGLREGKESQVESRVQQALTLPVRRVAQKVQFGLGRLTTFFLYLTGGWLANSFINVLNANADGNIEALNKFKEILQRQLLIAGGTILALTLGFKGILTGLGFLGTTALRIARGGLLRQPFVAIANALKLGLLGGGLYVGASNFSTGNRAADTVIGGAGGVGGALVLNSIFEFISKKFGGLSKAIIKNVPGGSRISEALIDARKIVRLENIKGIRAAKGAVTAGGGGFLKKLLAPLRGKLGFFGTIFIDVLLFGENLDNAIAGAAGFVAGAKAGTAIGAAIGGLFGGIGAVPGSIIGGIIGGFLGPGVFKGLYKSIKKMFGFDVGGGGGNDDELELGDTEYVTGGSISIPGGESQTMSSLSAIGKKNAEVIETQNKNLAESITPVNKKSLEKVDEKIASLDEGAPTIVNIPIAGMGGQSGQGEQSAPTPDDSTNKLPNIGFDNNNIHTMYATSTYGANA